jgi:hypothetical protein
MNSSSQTYLATYHNVNLPFHFVLLHTRIAVLFELDRYSILKQITVLAGRHRLDMRVSTPPFVLVVELRGIAAAM